MYLLTAPVVQAIFALMPRQNGQYAASYAVVLGLLFTVRCHLKILYTT